MYHSCPQNDAGQIKQVGQRIPYNRSDITENSLVDGLPEADVEHVEFPIWVQEIVDQLSYNCADQEE